VIGQSLLDSRVDDDQSAAVRSIGIMRIIKLGLNHPSFGSLSSKYCFFAIERKSKTHSRKMR
jgi:hypothetical protein